MTNKLQGYGFNKKGEWVKNNEDEKITILSPRTTVVILLVNNNEKIW